MKSFRTAALATLAAALLPVAAFSQPVTMDRLWPNDDGRQWIYQQRYEVLPYGPITDSRIRLLFDGPALAPDGIAAQYLRHEVLSSSAAAVVSASGIADPLLDQVWLARPDLREKIEATLAGASCPGIAPPGPHAVLLNGEFAWRRTADEIAAWRCNLANTRSWQWLISNLTPGANFTLQLLPDIASDILLFGAINDPETVEVPAGVFENCVRVDYVVDYGLSMCTDAEGHVTGSHHSKTRGIVYFAPDVGPVKSSESFFPYLQVTGTCGDPYYQDLAVSRTTLQLEDQPTPARGTSWGAVKVLYR